MRRRDGRSTICSLTRTRCRRWSRSREGQTPRSAAPSSDKCWSTRRTRRGRGRRIRCARRSRSRRTPEVSIPAKSLGSCWCPTERESRMPTASGSAWPRTSPRLVCGCCLSRTTSRIPLSGSWSFSTRRWPESKCLRWKSSSSRAIRDRPWYRGLSEEPRLHRRERTTPIICQKRSSTSCWLALPHRTPPDDSRRLSRGWSQHTRRLR